MNELYHIEVYMPDEYIQKTIELQKTLGRYYFSRHLKDYFSFHDYKHAIDKKVLINCINNLRSNPVTPFEIELDGDEVIKYVVRVPYSEELDISIAMLVCNSWGNPMVKTAWLNSKDDTHHTLDFSKYVDKSDKN